MFCEIGLEEYPAPAGFGAGNEPALSPRAQLLGVHLQKGRRLSQGEGNHDDARELIRSASSSSALPQSSHRNRPPLRRQPTIISAPSKTCLLSKHLFGEIIGAGSAEPSACSKASLSPYDRSSSSILVLPNPVFSTLVRVGAFESGAARSSVLKALRLFRLVTSIAREPGGRTGHWLAHRFDHRGSPHRRRWRARDSQAARTNGKRRCYVSYEWTIILSRVI